MDQRIVAAAAEVAHEANRAYCRTIGEEPQPEWSRAPQWQRDSAIAGVHALLDGKAATPREQHERWMEDKEFRGWVYGETKDPEKLTHPCLVAYDELPEEQKVKDALFRAVVQSIVPNVREDHATSVHKFLGASAPINPDRIDLLGAQDGSAPDDQHEHGAFVGSVKHALREHGGWALAVDIAGMDGMKAQVWDIEAVLSDLAARGAVGHRVDGETHQYRAAEPERGTRPVGFATRLRMVYEALARGGTSGYATEKQVENITALSRVEAKHAIVELRRAGLLEANPYGNVRCAGSVRDGVTDLIFLEVVENLVGETTLHQLAHTVGLSNDEAWRIVDRLKERGLIETRGPRFGALGVNPVVFVGGQAAIEEYDEAFDQAQAESVDDAPEGEDIVGGASPHVRWAEAEEHLGDTGSAA